MKTDIRHLFFDLDHTLWDFDRNSAEAYKILLSENGFPVNFEDFHRIYEPLNLQYWEDYAAGKVTKEEVKNNRLKETLAHFGIRLSETQSEQLADRYLELLAQGRKLFDGALETLAYLKKCYRLHLITNGFTEVQETKIKNTGLQAFFETVTITEKLGVLKPHPKVFRHALKQAGAFAHESVMIGDSWKSDIAGALNTGMQAVFFDPYDQTEVPLPVVKKITRLEELKSLFPCPVGKD